MDSLFRGLMSIVILSLSAVAADDVDAAGFLADLNSPSISIETVFIHQNGAVTLFVDNVTSNPDSCGDVKKVHLKSDLPGRDQILASALTAFTARKKIGLYSSGCEIIPFWSGSVTRPIVREIWIRH